MHIYSELIQAQAENLASDPTPGKKGRLYHKDTTEPLKVDDGTTLHKVLTDQMYTAIKAGVVAEGITNSEISQNYMASGSSGAFATTSTSFVDVDNLEVTITTGGNPVEVYLFGGSVSSYNSSGTITSSDFQVDRDGIETSNTQSIGLEVGGATSVKTSVPAGALKFIFQAVSAGEHTFRLQARSLNGSISTQVASAFLVAKEL